MKFLNKGDEEWRAEEIGRGENNLEKIKNKDLWESEQSDIVGSSWKIESSWKVESSWEFESFCKVRKSEPFMHLI